MTLRIRPLTPADAATVARLHAESWRSAYRGIFDDQFLERDVHAERLGVWTERLHAAPATGVGFIAEVNGDAAGFIFIRPAHDPQWGTMLDNLHVLDGFRSHGIGRQLIADGMTALMAQEATQPVWLWVYEQNAAARRVYQRLDGREAERSVERAADGSALAKWRVVWDSPHALLRACGDSRTRPTGP